MAMPTEDIDMNTMVGRKAKYVDKNGKEWHGVVIDVADQMAVIKFDQFPSGLGQGQIVEIE